MKLVLACTLTAVVLAHVALLPARAQDASVRAYDFAFEDAANPGSTTVTIPAGGVVAFAYPAGGNAHNVVFGGAQPASCTQTAGPNAGSVPPLPAVATAPGWARTCRFDAPGTYTFVCDAHDYMTGAVAVGTAPPVPAPPGAPAITSAAAGDRQATIAFTTPPATARRSAPTR